MLTNCSQQDCFTWELAQCQLALEETTGQAEQPDFMKPFLMIFLPYCNNKVTPVLEIGCSMCKGLGESNPGGKGIPAGWEHQAGSEEPGMGVTA